MIKRLPKAVSFADKAQYLRLMELAKTYGLFHAGKPSISGLIQKIADREIPLNKDIRLGDADIGILINIIYLINNQSNTLCRKLIEVLLELPLPEKFKQDVRKTKEALMTSVIEELENAIAFCMPFKISYKVDEEIQEYEVVSAKIENFRNHRYLVAKTREAIPDYPIKTLSYNRTFYLKNIVDFEYYPEEWQELPSILVSFVVHEGYESKPDDISDGKLIHRGVSVWEFFLTEMFSYGKVCEIISPPIARELIKQELNQMQKIYTRFT